MVENLIIGHSSLDGIISVVMVFKRFELPIVGTNVAFTQPFTVDRLVIPDDAERIFVVDVAVNNRNPEMTKSFIRKLGDRLVLWCDHHDGWTEEITGGNKAFRIEARAKSCASILALTDELDLWADADAADTRTGTLSQRAQLIEHAVKADMTDDFSRVIAVKWLLGDESARPFLETKAKEYTEILVETERLAVNYRVNGNIALVNAYKYSHQHCLISHPYDLTQLLLAGQKLAPFAVVMTTPMLLGDGLAITTSRKDVNLVELFGLDSGSSFQVSLPSKRLKEVIAKLATV